MKKFITRFIPRLGVRGLLILIFISLGAKGDYWTQKAGFPGAGIASPFSFSIGGKGYVGCGHNISMSTNSFWEYDPAANAWTQKANFGGVARYYASGFSITNKGYAGLGTTGGASTQTDFWEYDPSINVWVQKSNFPGVGRIGPAVFSVGSYGYIVAGGINPYYNDIWQYNPASDTWTQKNNLTGLARGQPSSFIIGTSGFLIGGTNGSVLFDVWEYNTITDIWTQRANLPVSRVTAMGFSLCDKGYLTLGMDSTFQTGSWQYDPFANQWSQKASFPGSGRHSATNFSVTNKTYCGLGWSGGIYYHTDFWEYTPDSACATGIEETAITTYDIQISPNPVKEFTICSWQFAEKEKTTLKVFDTAGKKIISLHPTTNNCQLTTNKWPKGIYTVQVTAGNKTAIKQFVKD